VAVQDEQGRVVMESVLQTRAAAILDFLHGVGYATRHPGGRNAFGVVVRSAGAAGGEIGGVQSAEECAVEVGE